MELEHFDVLIMGAGLSGIGAAYHLQKHCPNKSYIILEQRDRIGGTWDLFRYPGIRSDSDMFTMGYSFRPWTNTKAISPGEDIRALLREFASMAGTVLTGDAAGAIEDRCGGNPLLARELLLHASRRATRAGVMGRAAQTGDDDELPLSVRGLIAEWLAPFDDAERNVLQHAALLGDGFSVADISKIIPVAPEVVRAAVSRARSRRLIVEARDGRAFYRFRHRVVADLSLEA